MEPGANTLQPVRLVVRDRPKRFPEDDDAVTVESLPKVTLGGQVHSGSTCGQDPQRRRRQPRSAPPGAIGYFARKATVPVAPSGEGPISRRRQGHPGPRRTNTGVVLSADGFADDPHFDIEWAGDLDADGNLDLIVNLSRKSSVSRTDSCCRRKHRGPNWSVRPLFSLPATNAGASGVSSRR